MGFDDPILGLLAVQAIAVAAMIAIAVGPFLMGLFRDRRRFNSTADWTPVAGDVQKVPAGQPLTPFESRLVTAHLEPGETLEGFARALFAPPRVEDWKVGSGLEKVPLLVAATSRRILLLEVTILTVHRHRFVPYDEIAYLRPPKPGLLGTSGRWRFGLRSGLEYQLEFFGPLANEEGMRQERNLAAHLRRIAPRFASSPPPRSSPRRAAA